jgi:SNF2 family DNA or RNA helicase
LGRALAVWRPPSAGAQAQAGVSASLFLMVLRLLLKEDRMLGAPRWASGFVGLTETPWNGNIDGKKKVNGEPNMRCKENYDLDHCNPRFAPEAFKRMHTLDDRDYEIDLSSDGKRDKKQSPSGVAEFHTQSPPRERGELTVGERVIVTAGKYEHQEGVIEKITAVSCTVKIGGSVTGYISRDRVEVLADERTEETALGTTTIRSLDYTQDDSDDDSDYGELFSEERKDDEDTVKVCGVSTRSTKGFDQLQRRLYASGMREKHKLFDYQCAGVLWMEKQEQRQDWQGGVLADDMGLGKTIQLLSLMALNPRPTLVLLPGTVKHSWENDHRDFFQEGTFIFVDWGGGGAKKQGIDPSKALPQNLIALCTPDTMKNDVLSGSASSGYTLDESSVLYRAGWGRILIDEAQCLRNGSKKAGSKTPLKLFTAANHLQAASRWALSGTPIENGVGDYLSILQFLRATPYSDPAWFGNNISQVLQTNDWVDSMDTGAGGKMFADTMLRRTKGAVGTEHTPVKYLSLQAVTLSEEEQTRHAAVVQEEDFPLVRVLRSRQCADGIAFPRSAVESELTASGLTEQSSVDEMSQYCAKMGGKEGDLLLATLVSAVRDCKDKDEETLRQKAYWSMSWELAWLRALEDKPRMLRTSKMAALARLLQQIWSEESANKIVECAAAVAPRVLAAAAGEEYKRQMERDMTNWSGIGVDGEVHTQQVRMETGPLTTIVMFSQWPTRGFEVVKHLLKKMGKRYMCIDSTVPPTERKARIDAFTPGHPTYDSADPVQVMLLGLHSGGTGINLQSAQVGILLDLWWNPQVERQATDRVHRVGSPHAANYFFKFVANDTYEGLVNEKQEDKLQLAADTVDLVANGLET